MPSEAEVQAAVRLEYARRGYRLFRNNVGVLPDANGRPVRYGLANESPQVNRRLKSSDLIGWDRVIITPVMVGQTIARFVSLEIKGSGWTLTDGDERGQAQKRWVDMVAADGGEAGFIVGLENDLHLLNF